MEDEKDDLRKWISRFDVALARLEARLQRVESFVGVAGVLPPRLVTEPPAEGRPAAEPLQPQPGIVAVPAAPSPRREPVFALPRLSSELEVVIGTSWLNRLGILAIIAAVAYFVKYSFDNQWIGPAGRVGLTFLLGAFLLVAGERYQRLRLGVFAQGLTGGGIAVLYLAVYAAFAIYRLVGFSPAFATMVLITVAATLLALRYDSLAIATLGLLGGFATPLVLGGDRGPGGGAVVPVTAALYAYFLLLDGATYLLARRKSWWIFGGVGMAAGFLAPVLVAVSGQPHSLAATVYFLIITLAAVALSLTLTSPQAPWPAVALATNGRYEWWPGCSPPPAWSGGMPQRPRGGGERWLLRRVLGVTKRLERLRAVFESGVY